MINAKYISDGENIELSFESMEELDRFIEERRVKRREELRAQEAAMKEKEQEKQKKVDEIVEEMSNLFVRAKDLGVKSDHLIDILRQSLELASEKCSAD